MAEPHIVQLPRIEAATPISVEIIKGLQKPPGQRTLPTILLYDEQGLRLYDEITTKAPEYYLFPAEEEILRQHGGEIVRLMHDGEPVQEGEVVLELGAGALRKTSHILRSLADYVDETNSENEVSYLALDLELRELERTLGDITKADLGAHLDGRVSIGGLCGTYDDGVEYIRGGGLLEQRSTSSVSSVATPDDTPSADSIIGLKYDDVSSTHNHDTDMRGRSPDEEPISLSSSNSPSLKPEVNPPDVVPPPLHFMFLGASIGNFHPQDAANFLRSLPLRPWDKDTLLLGLDHDNEPRLVELAYDDPAGYTRRFMMNGLIALKRTLMESSAVTKESVEVFGSSNWDYSEYYNTEQSRHEGRYLSKRDQFIQLPDGQKIEFAAGETLHVESSYKYSEQAANDLFASSNLQPIHRWTSTNGLYSLWLLRRPSFIFPVQPSPLHAIMHGPLESYTFPISNSGEPQFPTIPTLDEWRNLWALSDAVTLGMIPPTMLHQKPIDLRHKCLFYLGHIPAFLDIHLSRILDESHTEPEYFKVLFERGIDPHVDDPTQCHPHSEVPEDDESWPSLDSILEFRNRVRTRLNGTYAALKTGGLEKRGLPIRRVQRALWMTFEHEAFHVETLLYMLIQRAGGPDGTRPPPGVRRPDWAALTRQWSARLVGEAGVEKQLTIGPTEVWLGHDDFEAQDLTNPNVDGHEFGWDNEHPRRRVVVERFKVDRLPITNREYLSFWRGEGGERPAPCNWLVDDGEVKVRTLFGPIPIDVAYDWPVVASYDDLNAFAQSKGGRIPTEGELRLFMDDQASRGVVQSDAGWGFQRWWPEPPSLGNADRNLAPHNGGVWEWSSTLLDKHDRFQPSTLYPGYSTDFFDKKHHVVLGGSFATLPRLAQRRSLRNFYQHNYPYAWIGARVAYDA